MVDEAHFREGLDRIGVEMLEQGVQVPLPPPPFWATEHLPQEPLHNYRRQVSVEGGRSGVLPLSRLRHGVDK